MYVCTISYYTIYNNIVSYNINYIQYLYHMFLYYISLHDIGLFCFRSLGCASHPESGSVFMIYMDLYGAYLQTIAG